MSVFRFLSILLLLLTGLCAPACAEIITGRVVGVTDGDTLTLLDSSNQTHKIRLAGIDAPEKNQDFGQKAKAGLSELAYGRAGTASCQKKDRYRRDVCVVKVNGKDVGLEQIRTGLAWWYRQYAKEQTRQERVDYEKAEQDAKNRHLGLWSSNAPMPPSEWRHIRGKR